MSSVDLERLETRKKVKSLLSLMEPEWHTPLFWELLLEETKKHLPKEVVDRDLPAPMDDKEAKHFETTKMPVGKHRGDAIKDIPFDYLDWVADNFDPDDNIRIQIVRYLRAERTQRLRAYGEEDEVEEHPFGEN